MIGGSSVEVGRFPKDTLKAENEKPDLFIITNIVGFLAHSPSRIRLEHRPTIISQFPLTWFVSDHAYTEPEDK